MKLFLRAFIFVLILSSCSKEEKETSKASEKFATELVELKEYFQIPGLAVSLVKDGEVVSEDYLGFSDYENKISLDSTHQFPIASLTKVFSGVLIMKLVEEEKLSLNTPVKKYFPDSKIDPHVLIKHILSHTSQGEIGKHFYYSSRFGALTKIIEEASGKSFKVYMEEVIFQPLQLKNTFLLKDSTQVTSKMAKPYALEDGIQKGFVDHGYSTSAGIVSNLHDLQVFNQALDQNTLISEKSKNLMFSSENGLPYGYGIFNQEIEGVKVVWAYGQYDCYSSLFLKVPSQNITLTVLANNNLMSDPARLIYGDVTSSLFAMSFLKNYVFEFDQMDLFETKEALEFTSENTEFYKRKLLAQALSESFMSRFDTEKIQMSESLLKAVFSEHSDYLEYADMNLLHNLTFLKDVAFYRDLDEFTSFDEHIEKIGSKLLKEDSENPYVNMYLGTFYDRKGNSEKAKYYFDQILNAKNFSRNWYTTEAESWLKNFNRR